MLAATTVMFAVKRRVGRLIEARVRALPDLAAADAYVAAIRSAVLGVAPGSRAVICADHRAVPVYPPAVADRLIELFTTINPRVERAGLLVAKTNATVTMQIGRIVREAANAQRRVFTSAASLTSFLGEVVDPAESEAMRAFLAGG